MVEVKLLQLSTDIHNVCSDTNVLIVIPKTNVEFSFNNLSEFQKHPIENFQKIVSHYRLFYFKILGFQIQYYCRGFNLVVYKLHSYISLVI
jgi:hypothetical protein